MSSRGRSYLILGATLLIGVLLGALLVGALSHRRDGRTRGMRGPAGFVAEMERLIEPRDEEQRAAIQPLLEATAASNDRMIREFGDEMREALESMIAELEPHLDADQLERLRRFANQPPPPPGGPGRHPPKKKR